VRHPHACEGAFDALALLAAGVPRVVAIFGVQGWRWA
jgi:DNA primase